MSGGFDSWPGKLLENQVMFDENVDDDDVGHKSSAGQRGGLVKLLLTLHSWREAVTEGTFENR